jgi:hypothetical protein
MSDPTPSSPGVPEGPVLQEVRRRFAADGEFADRSESRDDRTFLRGGQSALVSLIEWLKVNEPRTHDAAALEAAHAERDKWRQEAATRAARASHLGKNNDILTAEREAARGLLGEMAEALRGLVLRCGEGPLGLNPCYSDARTLLARYDALGATKGSGR